MKTDRLDGVGNWAWDSRFLGLGSPAAPVTNSTGDQSLAQALACSLPYTKLSLTIPYSAFFLTRTK